MLIPFIIDMNKRDYKQVCPELFAEIPSAVAVKR